MHQMEKINTQLDGFIQTLEMFHQLTDTKEQSLSSQNIHSMNESRIKLISSIIPFLNPETAIRMEILLKLCQIQFLLPTTSNTMSAQGNALNQKQILETFQAFAPEKSRPMIDTMLNIFNMKEMMEVFQSFPMKGEQANEPGN